ncbi:MAG TPA: guanylate kinase [Oligoflexia bacterium]|nr:guanylate kinase [Oligoflexia bacterium]
MSNKRPTASNAKLIVLSAPSGAGKSTLCTLLLAKHPRFKISISHTTRKPRGEEQHGTHYFFISEKEFQEMISRNDFLEYAHVFGRSWYGTSKQQVEDALAQNFHVVFDIDVQGARALKQIYGKRCVTIFVLPPSFEELEKRLRARATESESAIQSRLETAKKELREATHFDHQIVNQELSQAMKELETILTEEDCL